MKTHKSANARKLLKSRQEDFQLQIPLAEGAAFFDIDNTLIRGSSLVAAALFLGRKGHFSILDVCNFAWVQFKFRLTRRENPQHMEFGRGRALQFIAGRREEDLASSIGTFITDLVEQRMYTGTLELIRQCQRHNVPVWLVSATPVEIGQIIAAHIHVEGALGTVAEKIDGRYTGNLVGNILHGQHKARAVLRFMQQHGYRPEACLAFSDSYNDEPLLSLVGFPHAVNPDQALKDQAHQKGWPVFEFRKKTGGLITKNDSVFWGSVALVSALVTGIALWRVSTLTR